MRTNPGSSSRPDSAAAGRRRPARSHTPVARDQPAEFTIRLSLTLAVVAGFLASRAGPSNWLWGMNILRYYPSAMGFLLLSLTVAAIWMLPARDDGGPLGRRLTLHPALTGLLAGLAALVLFVIFRSKSFLLGDGLELIRRLHQGDIPAPRAPLFNALQPVFFRLFEQGDPPRSGESAAVISFLAGFLAVAIVAFHLLRIARSRPAAAATAAALLLTGGGMQLFFGYIEVYSLLATGTLIFMAAGFDRLTGGGRAATASATLGFVMAILAHPFGSTLLPAWLYLVSGRPEGEGWRLSRRVFVVIVGAGGALLLLLALVFALNPDWQAPGVRFRYLAPQVQIHGLIRGLEGFNESKAWASDYTVLSWRHAADCWNTLWLSGAAALAFVVGSLAVPAGRLAIRKPTVLFPLLGFGMILLYRFLWRTPLGALRDWDLYAGLGFGIGAIAAGLSLAGIGRRLAGPTLAAALYFLVPWIGIQIDSGRAASRHFDGVDAEPRPEPMVAAQFHGAMGDRFSGMRDFTMAARAYERALQIRPRHEYAWRLGMAHFAAGRFDAAIPALQKALDLRPNDRTTLIALAEVNVDAGNSVAADQWIDRALALYPDAGAAWLQRGRSEFRKGRLVEAAAAFDRADSLFSSKDIGRRDLVRAREALAAAAPSVPAGAPPH